MSDHDYKTEQVADYPSCAIIKIAKHALGGNDALNFTSALNSLSKSEIKLCIADLSEVEIMNSSGLGMLVSGLSTLRKYNIEFVLAALPKKVEELMKMTRLDTIFKIFPDVPTALK